MAQNFPIWLIVLFVVVLLFTGGVLFWTGWYLTVWSYITLNFFQITTSVLAFVIFIMGWLLYTTRPKEVQISSDSAKEFALKNEEYGLWRLGYSDYAKFSETIRTMRLVCTTENFYVFLGFFPDLFPNYGLAYNTLVVLNKKYQNMPPGAIYKKIPGFLTQKEIEKLERGGKSDYEEAEMVVEEHQKEMAKKMQFKEMGIKTTS